MATDTRNIGEKKSILDQATGSMLSSGLSTKKQADDNTIVKSSDGSEVITDPSKVKPKNIAEVAKESNKSSGEGSFIKLNEKQKDQIQASYDRSNMRQAARLLKNTGEIGTIKSEYADEKSIGRLDLKNIKAQERINKRLESSRNRLDKKILKQTGDASLTYKNRSAKQAADEERFSNIAKNLNVQSGVGPYPLASVDFPALKKLESKTSLGSSYKNSNYINKFDRGENVKKFQSKYGAKNINEWENKNALEDKDKTNAKF